MDTSSNIWRLLLEGDHQTHGFVIEAFAAVIISNVLDSISDNLLIVDDGFAGNLSTNHDHSCLGLPLVFSSPSPLLKKPRLKLLERKRRRKSKVLCDLLVGIKDKLDRKVCFFMCSSFQLLF